MFKWYKEKQKQKYEKSIQSCIEFNNCRIKIYKSYLNQDSCILTSPYEQELGIAQRHSREFLSIIHKKYNVNKKLIDLEIKSYTEAMNEFKNMEKRMQETKIGNEEKEKVKLYKKAILELKNEGKI